MRDYKIQPKPLFKQRMNSLLKDEQDKEKYWEIVSKETPDSIRCNTLKISPEELKKRLEKEYSWQLEIPFEKHPEIMIIKNPLLPGVIGRTKEHILGYYYVQDIASMMPIIELAPNENDSFLDLCASPGSKTTQAVALMKNKGNILANENKLHRMMILSANLERTGTSNTMITIKDGDYLCILLAQKQISFDKILVDVPCSGEGTVRNDKKAFLIWNPKMIRIFSHKQKKLLDAAIKVLKQGGQLIYSTCTHAPEENEEVIDYVLKNNPDIKVQEITLPIKTRKGLTQHNEKKYNENISKAIRIYPQDNDTEGFFMCKLKKI